MKKAPFDFKSWIESEAGQSVIRDVARWLKSNPSTRRLFGIPDGHSLDEIQQELCIFLLEAKNIPWEVWLNQSQEKISKQLAIKFSSHLRDEARKKRFDPARYLYRRLRQLLRENQSLFYTSDRRPRRNNRKGASPINSKRKQRAGRIEAYSCHRQSESIGYLTQDDLEQIPFPFNELNAKILERDENLTTLAKSFWERVSNQYGKPVWVKLEDLLYWIEKHIAISHATISMSDLPEERDKRDTPEAEVTRNFSKRELLEKMETLVSKLDNDEIQIFYLAKGPDPKTLEEIARILNYAGPSGVHGQLKRLEKKLRDFCDKNFPDEERYDGFFDDFLDGLLGILEKRVKKIVK